ncbi:39S ribosomal protein L22, mitochondrial [Tieghemiomyces parasiticus]|uniref:39S ribosomal protein L22, mitochondrial n=1 Tax=Tieghemiomyces parasiticus TaxID=78921 RepID=A0A9W8A221_9FUNG|nr:39S ribosomal protein L22, mitochondrial [Tieghemiomyces parasiticus]
MSALRILRSGLTSLHTSAFRAENKDDLKYQRPNLGASPLFDLNRSASEAGAAGGDVSRSQTDSFESLKTSEFTFKTANYKTGYRKLRFLAKQISGKPVQEAIDQMEFSSKRWARNLMHNLASARTNVARFQGIDPANLIVSRTWTGKGKYTKRLDFKGRGRAGMIRDRESHIRYQLKEVTRKPQVEGPAQRRNIKRFNIRKKIWTPMKEAKPIYNPCPYYNW